MRFFWEVVVRDFTEDLWIQNFRMKRSTFLELCNAIGPLVSPAASCPREPVSTNKRIAIAVYKLATCAEYRVVAETFGISKTTVHRCVYGVCQAICTKLMKQYIALPNVQEAQQIAQRNYEAQRIPQVYGAIDGTHIPIRAPSDGYRDYVNRKGWTSIVLQAVVDDQLMIRDICVGSPGSAHDAAVFATSNLFRYPAKHPQESLEIEGVQVPLLLAGDPAYPLLPWVMKGFSGPNLTEAQTLFNEQLSTIRVKVEHTFGHLKTRWRVLAKMCDIDHDFMPTVVATCCILHNICEGDKQQLPPAALQVHPAPQQPQGHTRDEPDAPALEIRQALVNHLLRPH
ncbi:hypothetical protein R3I93_012495 [Phoxinus phoxinus]|uniref:DDE Tnp4 domain-containing protein n=2 Tax=Phoxinus phoxinus TaxID=58324 RepID=A0AAN9CS21_9TELE